MPTGELLGWFLLGLALIWGALDFVVWLRGGQTLSRWVVRESKKRAAFAIATFLLVTLFAAWLVEHWELIPIIWGHFND